MIDPIEKVNGKFAKWLGLLTIILLCIYVQSCQTMDANTSFFQHLANGNIDHYLSEAEILQEHAAALPSQYVHLITDDEDCELLQLRIHHELNLFQPEIRDLYRSTKMKNRSRTYQLEAFLLYIDNFYLDPKYKKSLLHEIDNWIAQLNKIEYIDRYYILQLLDRKAQIFYDQGQDTPTMSTYHYLLHLIVDSDQPYTLVKENALMQICRLLIKDYSDNISSAAAIEAHLAQLSSGAREKIEFKILQQHINLYKTQLSNQAIEDVIKDWLKLLHISDDATHQLSILLNLMLYDSERLCDYTRQGLDILNRHECNQYRSVFIILGEQCMSSETLNNEIHEIGNCGSFLKDRYQIQKMGISQDQGFELLNLNAKMDYLLRKRAIADRLAQGKSLYHLQDLFLSNSTAMIHTLQDHDQIDQSHYETLLRTLEDTQRKSTYIRLNQIQSHDGSLDQDNVYAQINHALLLLDDFKKPVSFENTIYEDLYQNIMIAESRSYALPDQHTEISLKEIQTKLHADQSQLNYLTYEDGEYYAFIADGKSVDLVDVDLDRITALYRVLLEAIENQSPIDDALHRLSFYLRSHGIARHDKLDIIATGVMYTLPWELLFPESKIRRYTHLEDYLDANPIQISSEGAVVYSYSDERSIKSLESNTVSELPIGWEEALEIATLLDAELFAGKSFTRSDINKAWSADLLHISAHASYQEHRLDNYIIVRDRDGKAIPYYSYELYDAEKTPIVTILSACDTGMGTDIQGYGSYAFSRCLVDNGTESVIKTLWPVNESATRMFMIRFYEAWINGNTIETALEIAKSAVKSREAYAHPYYWAGVVLEGNPHITLHHTE